MTCGPTRSCGDWSQRGASQSRFANLAAARIHLNFKDLLPFAFGGAVQSDPRYKHHVISTTPYKHQKAVGQQLLGVAAEHHQARSKVLVDSEVKSGPRWCNKREGFFRAHECLPNAISGFNKWSRSSLLPEERPDGRLRLAASSLEQTTAAQQTSERARSTPTLDPASLDASFAF
eukprot:scaffold1398_cov259-Pinguiococcus_pyrenoidosus.AAC.1